MTPHQRQLTLAPRARGLHDITQDVAAVIAETGVGVGVCHVFIRHTSASLVIQENADPDVQHDLERFFSAMAPDGDPAHRHQDEGPDDMPAHIKAAMTNVALSMPITDGVPGLGTWQGVYLWEHRNAARARTLTITIFGV